MPSVNACKDAALEVRARVQRGDGGPVGVADVAVADAEHVVFDPSGDQGDLGFHELRDARRVVQRDGGPYPADAVLGHAMAVQEAAGLIGAVHLETPAAAAELLVQAEVVEHRPYVQQFGVEAEIPVAALQAAPE